MQEARVTGLITALQAALEARNWDQVDECWLELLEGELPPTAPLVEATHVLLDQGQEERVQSLQELTIPLLQEGHRHDEILELLRPMVQQRPDDAALRQLLLETIRQARAGRADITEILDRAQHREPRGALRLLQMIDQLLAFQVGDFVEDPKGWGFGQVVSYDLDRLEITVDFRTRRGHRIPLESASDFLEWRDPEHFTCMLMARREELEREAEEDPAGLVRRILRFRGLPTPLRVIRELVTAELVPATAWSRLWNRARPELRQDPFVEMSEGAQPTLALRAQACTREEEMELALRRAGNAGETVKLVRAYLAEPPTPGRESFLPQLAERLAPRREEAATSGEYADFTYLLDRVARARGATRALPELEALVQDLAGLPERLLTMQSREHALQHCRDVVATRPEGWVGALTELLATDGILPGVRELILRATAEGAAREARDRELARVLESPRTLPEPFFWASTRALEGKLQLDHLPGGQPLDLLERHLRLIDELLPRTTYEGDAGQRTMLLAARRIVTPELVGRMAEGLPESGARRLAAMIAASTQLDVATRELCHVAILEHHDVLPSAPPETSEEVLWTTRAGLAKRLKEYDHLINVEIKDNGIALGKARELGDLSENAEWDAAREEERRLITRQRRMSQELNLAREIAFGSGHMEQVAPGSRVKVRDEATGEESTYSLLGPWDVQPEAGCISYLSHLGSGLLGRSAGEVVEVPLPSGTTTLRVLEVVWATPPDGEEGEMRKEHHG